MGVAERKMRQNAERERRIVNAARAIAEREGWSAVTVRRLADAIEYSQPVLYSHFPNREAILSAVAIDGFREIAEALRSAAGRSQKARDVLENVANAYLDFAVSCPAVYDAMFILPTGLRFAEADTRPEQHAAFEALAIVIAPFCRDAPLAAEAFWGTLHGLATLERGGRIRLSARAARVALVARAIAGHTAL
jgi:AcrR family transcriptional regulator